MADSALAVALDSSTASDSTLPVPPGEPPVAAAAVGSGSAAVSGDARAFFDSVVPIGSTSTGSGDRLAGAGAYSSRPGGAETKAADAVLPVAAVGKSDGG